MRDTNPQDVHQYWALKSPSAKSERVIVFLLFAIFSALFCNFQLVTVGSHHLDSAFLMETLTSIKTTGIPTTYVVQSFSEAMSTFTQLAEKLCQSELIPSALSINMLDIHAYFFLYPLAMLTWLFPPHVIIAVANGLGFSSVIFIVYWVIRRKGVPILGAIAFCLLVMAHPAWSHASLGDFYVDRFFMPLGLLYAALLHDAIIQQKNISRNYLLLIISIGLFAASTTERGTMMIVLFTIASLALYRKKIIDRGMKASLIIFSLTLLVYLFLYLKLLHIYHAGAIELSTLLQGMPSFFENLHSPAFAAQVQEFLVINVLLFGIFSLFEWRLAVIAFIALLPNLLTLIGGSVKNGWATHYHSMYFPFLVLASAIGFSRLWILLGSMKYRMILVGLLLALIPAISKYSPGYGGQIGAVTRLYDFYANGYQLYEKQQAARLQQIAAAVPLGAKVTTLEVFMSTLYRDRSIYFYPVGIDVADYAVLTQVIEADGSLYYTGAVSYLVGETPKVDACLNDRLKKAGYNVEHPLVLLGNLAVLERKNK